MAPTAPAPAYPEGVVEITAAIVIERTVGEVAAFAGDPGNAAAWFAGTEHVEWHTQPPARVGSRFTFVLKSLRCEYAVTELEPGARLSMHTDDGPFPLDTTFTWEPHEHGTLMIVTTLARPKGFRTLFRGFITAATRRSHLQDLRDLKQLLERTVGT